METTKIIGITPEAEGIKTLRTVMEVNAAPGQYVMVWISGHGEKPMSLSYVTGNLGVTVFARGPFTTRLYKKNKGESIGIRGPYGRGFNINGEKLLIVGGGAGMPPLAALTEKSIEDGKTVTAIVGAKTKSGLLFVERLRNTGSKVLISTDDGSSGTRGQVTGVLSELLKDETFDHCYTCGPEIMMKNVIEQTKKMGIPTQASIERYIKCGIGICGHCAIDASGLRVCFEGPVFTDKELENTEFGKYARNSSGKKAYFE